MVFLFMAGLYVTLFVVAVLKVLGRVQMAKKQPQLWTKTIPVSDDTPLTEAGAFLPKLSRFDLLERKKS